MKANVKYGIGASFTVEAVFLVPILTYILLLFIYMGMFLHDYIILITNTNAAVENYIDMERNGLRWEEELPSRLNQALWISNAELVRVEKNGFTICLEAAVGAVLPKSGIFRVFQILGFRKTYTKEQLLLDRSETARIFTAGVHTLSRIKGIGDYIDQYFRQN